MGVALDLFFDLGAQSGAAYTATFNGRLLHPETKGNNTRGTK
jgi:hypothetical protein